MDIILVLLVLVILFGIFGGIFINPFILALIAIGLILLFVPHRRW